VSGIFSRWQPRYAEHGIPTFPVGKDKKPFIKNWGQLGQQGSAKLAEKFDTAEAFGFALGPRSNITIVDMDAKDLLPEAEGRFGRAKVVVETPSGTHAYYRYNGERRLIRPFGPDIAIDVLGNGYALGSPSVVLKGTYELVRGSLEDLKTLPPMHQLDDLRTKKILDGQRNQSMFRIGLQQAPYVDDLEGLKDVLRTRNIDCIPPMDDQEVEKAAESAWKYQQEGRNLVGRGKAFVLSHELYDRIFIESPDALHLLLRLKRFHWGRDFILSKAMAAAMSWDVRRWRKARNLLVRLGIIACVHEGGRGPKDAPIYGWVDNFVWGTNV
jgi:hypothetical protein